MRRSALLASASILALLAHQAGASEADVYGLNTGITPQSFQPVTITNGALNVNTSGGVSNITPGVAGSASSSVVLKASSGNLYGAYVTTGATQGWLMVFNSTTAPSNESTTAGTASGNLQECVYAPANSTTGLTYASGPPEAFSAGITLMFSSTGCASLTASATGYLHGSIQ